MTTGLRRVMRLSSWRRARRAGRNGDSRARPLTPPRDQGCHCLAGQARLDAAGGDQAAALRYSVSTSAGVFHAECLAGSTVQRRRDGCELLGAVAGEVGASREVLAQQPVGVLVGGALPRAAWITEVDLKAAVELELDVLGHLDALVPGQGPSQLFGKGSDRVRDRITNGAGPGTRDRRSGLSFLGCCDLRSAGDVTAS